MSILLEIKNVNKQYKNGNIALKDVQLKIGRGMFGLLGPNGAGKSSLMRTLATLQEPDSGTIMLNGIDIVKEKDKTRSMLGYLPQEFGVYPRVSAIDLLDYLAILKGIADKGERKETIDYLLQKVNLFEHRKKAVSTYSGGMKQRFGIAQCLLGNPGLIIVDEPTAGLDPGERNRFYNILSEIGEDAILILSTHIVQDIEELCSQIAIMDKGSVIFNGKVDEALFNLQGSIYAKRITKNELSRYKQNYHVVSEKLVGGQPLIHVYSDRILDEGFTLAEASLEDVFFTTINPKG